MTDRRCLIVVLDQSESMNRPSALDPDRTLAQEAAQWLNDLFVALRDQFTDKILDVAVLGHSTDEFGEPLLSTDPANHNQPGVRPFTSVDELGKDDGGVIQPFASRGTATDHATQSALQLADQWRAEHEETPTVLVIGDGESRDGDLDRLDDAKAVWLLSILLSAKGDSRANDYLPARISPEVSSLSDSKDEHHHPSIARWQAISSVLDEGATQLAARLRDWGYDIAESSVGFISAPAEDELESMKWLVAALLLGPVVEGQS